MNMIRIENRLYNLKTVQYIDYDDSNIDYIYHTCTLKYNDNTYVFRSGTEGFELIRDYILKY